MLRRSLWILCLAPLVLTAAPGTSVHQALDPQAAYGGRAVDRDVASRLEALGYVEEVVDDPDPGRAGVTKRDGRAFQGVNYFCTGQSVRFLDMDGNLLDEVKLGIPTAGDSGCLAKPYRPGLMVVVRSPLLSLTSFRGDERWYREESFHHDVALDARGRIYSFARHDRVLRRGDRDFPVLDQTVVVLDGKGRRQRGIELLPLFGGLIPDRRLDAITRERAGQTPETRERSARTMDVFHPNSIEIVEWPHPGPGNGPHALIALRDLDRIAVVDLERPRVVWEWGAGTLIGPHDPWLLESGNVMVFDNGARPIDAPPRSFSRVVEVNPRDGSIVWQYPTIPSPAFFSPSRGGAQPLPNGNVLITESTKGRAFEVTRGGEIVWDFWNPDFRAQDGLRRTIYRMRRMSLESYRALRR